MTDPKFFGKFKVLRGTHTEGSPSKMYRMGEVLDSESNLLRFNSRGAVKFEMLKCYKKEDLKEFEEEKKSTEKEMKGADPETSYSKEELETLNVADLREMAEDEEVELDASMKKADIVSALLEKSGV